MRRITLMFTLSLLPLTGLTGITGLNSLMGVTLFSVTEAAAQNGSDSQPEAVGTYTITVSAGDMARSRSVVKVALPDRVADGVYRMTGDSGEELPLQVQNNRGHFLLEHLPAGESISYSVTLEPLSGSHWQPLLAVHKGEQTLQFSSEERDVLGYNYREIEPPSDQNPRFTRSGYIHPIVTPEGVEVTRQFNPGRPHQYALWSAWYRMLFDGRPTEFWNAQWESGRVEADTLVRYEAGPVYGGFTARHKFVDYSVEESPTVINEQWEVAIYPSAGERSWHMIDLDLVQTVHTNSTVEVLEHIYGGLNFRGSDDWNGEGLMQFDSSEGYGREEVPGQPVRWSHMSGEISGKPAGIAILGHPSSSDFPHGVFINSTEPFFSYGPVSLGNLKIESGAPWRAGYRLLVHDGELDAEEIERIWQDFAYPPAVTVSRR